MLRSSGRRCALNTRRRWKRSLLCELLHVRLQHCGRRAGVGNWSLRSFFLAMFVAHRAIDKCPNGNLKFQTDAERSEEHTSELQSLMRISYAVFCLKKKKRKKKSSTKYIKHDNKDRK